MIDTRNKEKVENFKNKIAEVFFEQGFQDVEVKDPIALEGSFPSFGGPNVDANYWSGTSHQIVEFSIKAIYEAEKVPNHDEKFFQKELENQKLKLLEIKEKLRIIGESHNAFKMDLTLFDQIIESLQQKISGDSSNIIDRQADELAEKLIECIGNSTSFRPNDEPSPELQAAVTKVLSERGYKTDFFRFSNEPLRVSISEIEDEESDGIW